MVKIRANADGLDEFMAGLKKLAEGVGDTACEMLEEAAPVIVDAMKKNIRAAATRTDERGKPYSKGALEKSIKATKPKKNAYGYFVAARPTGKDARKTRNGEKMAYLEYGTSKQAPRPIMEKTVAETERQATEKMTEVFEQKVNQYLG